MVVAPVLSTELLVTFFRGMAGPARLPCLLAVRERPRTVGEVVAETGLSQPNVSKHLACLRGCGLVAAGRSGHFVVYRLAGPRVKQVLASAERLLRDAEGQVGSCPYRGSRTVGPGTSQLEEEDRWRPH